MKIFLTGLILLIGSLYAQNVIQPDTGWIDSVTAQPDTIGNAANAGYDAQCMALWDVVQHREFADSMDIGVVAFHMNGIDRVEFAVDGGSWGPVTEMAYNARVNVWEYWVRLRAADFEEGLVEVRAVAYPKTAGVARVLNPLYLWADRGGLAHDTLWVNSLTGDDVTGDGSEDAPFATHDKALTTAKSANGDWSGLVLMTGEGDYVTPGWNESWEQRWMFIEGAPGTDMTKVRFTSRDGNRCNISKLAFRRVTMASATDNNLLYPSRPDKAHWFDDCRFKGIGPATAFAAVHRNSTGYHTSVTIDSFRYGGQNARLMRNVHVSNLAEDSFRPGSWTLMVNCSARNVDPEGTSAHPDVVQMYGGSFENTIIYGLDVGDGTVKSQGISPTTVKDLALVNCLLDPLPSSLGMNLESPMNHYLILNSTLNQSLRVRIDSLHNLVLKNSVLKPGVYGGPTVEQFNDMAVVDNLHVISTGLDTIINDTGEPLTYGNDSTVFNGYGSYDLSPADGSVLIGRTDNSWVPTDVYGHVRADSTAIGAIAYAGEYTTAIDNGQLTIGKQQPGMTVWPNPMGNYINMDRRDAPVGRLRINVYDRMGNVVWAVYPEAIHESPLRWDGTNQSGTPVPPGVYYISDGKNVTRIIKTR